MSNLTTEYRRRIEKLIDGKPTIAQKGTNHIDDNWSNETIYKGEIAIDINKGKAYTSDGSTSIEVNKRNTLQYGLQLIPVPGAANDANGLWACITTGKATINGKSYWHTSVVDADATRDIQGDISFSKNTSQSPIYYLVYGKAGKTYCEKHTSENEMYDNFQQYNLDFFAFSIGSQVNDLYSEEKIAAAAENAGYSLDDAIFIGIVWMPENYDGRGVNRIRPWNAGVSESGINYSFIKGSVTDALETSPGQLIDDIKAALATYTPSSNIRENKILIEGQVFTSGTSMYLVKKTHYCSSITESLDNEWIVMFGGQSGEGVSQHSSLGGLEYGITGHEGSFQRKTQISTAAPPSGKYDAYTAGGDMWIKIKEDGVVEAGWIYIEGKGWVEFLHCTKETTNYKNIRKDDLQGLVFTNKQADTFIQMTVNGLVANYDTDYYFKKDGAKVEFEDIDNVSNYDIIWTGDYDLDDNDIISLSYIESAPIVIDTTDWNVLDGGSSTKGMW